ncbi:MAG: hypothetical protein JWO52_6429 [Gammaproteobacteria bacterium]|nr:hypothetical protein [Gammaproteobacteria bacterium]
MKKARVLLFHNMVAPYRHALFAELAQSVELRVLYATLITRDRKWDTSIPDTYDSRVLNGPTAYAFGRPFTVCPRLLREVRDFGPDAVISVLTRSNAIDVVRLASWCSRTGVPLILWVCDVPRHRGTDEVPGLVSRPIGWLFDRALKRASGFVLESELTREWVEGRGLSSSRSVVCPPSFVPPAISPRIHVDDRPGRLQMVFVGKHEKRKGVATLIDSLSQLPRAVCERLSLATAGEGPLLDTLREAKPPGLELSTLGFQKPQVLSQLYRDADMTIIPSLHDPWANVANESMAVGTPVIASRQCGCVQLVRRTGWVVDGFDSGSVAQGILAAMEEARSAKRRTDSALAEAEYRPGPAAARIATLVDQLLERAS